MAKYRKLFIICGLLLIFLSFLISIFIQQWFGLTLALVGAGLILVGVALQIRDLSHFLKTRERKNDQLADRIRSLERNLETNFSESAEFRSEVTKELTAIKASDWSKFRDETSSLSTRYSQNQLSTSDLAGLEADHLQIVECLTANSGKKTLFLGSEGHCSVIEKYARNILNLNVDTVPIDEPESQVVTTIGQYELLLIWLPPGGELPPIVPFSWISDSEAMVFVGPALTAKMMDIQRLNYGTPVTLVIEDEVENLLAIKAVRSMEN